MKNQSKKVLFLTSDAMPKSIHKHHFTKATTKIKKGQPIKGHPLP